MGQCDVTVGTYSGTPLVGNENTPFPTNTASNIRRGARTQYIFRASELTDAGVCPGNIVGLTLDALQGDLTGPGADGIPGNEDDWLMQSMMQIDVRMGHTQSESFYDEIAMEPLPLDAAITASNNIHTEPWLPRYVAEGPFPLQLFPDSFIWNGVDNVILDITWMRNALNGLSPQVKMDDEVGFACTRWVRLTQGVYIDHGRTLSDNPLIPQASTGFNSNRPVITFTTTQGLSTTVDEVAGTTPTCGWDAQNEALFISAPSNHGPLSVTCYDAMGRVIAQERITGTTRHLVALGNVAPGPIVVQVVSADGATVLRDVLVKP